MFEPYPIIIQHAIEKDDGVGGFMRQWENHVVTKGYIDLITGTDSNLSIQKAIVEESTHVVILHEIVEVLDTMRIVCNNRIYDITYVDNPMGIGHHLELYCRFGGHA